MYLYVFSDGGTSKTTEQEPSEFEVNAVASGSVNIFRVDSEGVFELESNGDWTPVEEGSLEEDLGIKEPEETPKKKKSVKKNK